MEKATDTITCETCHWYNPHPKPGETVHGGHCVVAANSAEWGKPIFVLPTDSCPRHRGGSKRL